jgi:hypothetical protein
MWPQIIGGGTYALITFDQRIGVLTIQSGEFRPLVRGVEGRYLPSGHLVFDEGEGRIRVARLDLRRLTVTGDPVRAFEAFRGPGSGAAYFAVSRTGTLVYAGGGFERALVLVDRNGNETPVPTERRGYRFPHVSPDGKRVAVTIDPRPSSIWVVDLERGSAFRVTADDRHSIQSTWSRDGTRLAFTRAGLSWSNAQPGATPTSVGVKRGEIGPGSWIDQNHFLATVGYTSGDIVVVTLGDSATRPVVASPADEREPSLSSNGRWLAYASTVSGTSEVFVRPFPGSGPSTLVSTGGGREPRWSADGTELFYRRGTQIMSAKVRTGTTLAVVGPPRVLFSGPYDFTQDDNWDVLPDGRFLMIKSDPAAGAQLLAVFHWIEELKR